jgi:hypothetical protein
MTVLFIDISVRTPVGCGCYHRRWRWASGCTDVDY